MFLSIFTLLWALFLSGTAAVFSIVGLTALFSGAYLPVVAMGVAIEGGKLLAAAIVHHNWFNPRYRIIRWYLISAVVAGMLVTALGVYGFLAKAHLETAAPTAGVELQITRGEQQISTLKGEIARYESQMKQLDGVVDTLIQSGNIRGKNGANSIRETQAEERKVIQEGIDAAYREIGKIEDSLLPLRTANVAVEAKLGPLKYVAELIGKTEPGSALRALIFLIMWCFDPMAIILVIVSVMGLEDHFQRRKDAKEEAIRLRREAEDEIRRLAHEEEERAIKLREEQRIRDEKAEKARMAEERKTLQMELDNRYRKEAEDLRAKLHVMEEMSQSSVAAIEEIHHLREELSRKEDELQKMINLAGTHDPSLYRQMDDVLADSAALMRQLEEMSEKQAGLQSEKAALEGDLRLVLEVIDEREGEISRLIAAIEELTGEITQHESIMSVIQTEKDSFTRQIEELREEVERYREVITTLEGEIQQMGDPLVLNQEITRLLAVEKDALALQKEHTLLQEEHTALKTRYLSLHGEQAGVQKIISSLEEEKRNIAIERETILDELVARQSEVDQLNEQLAAAIALMETNGERQEATIQGLTARVGELEGMASREELEALQQALNEREEALEKYRTALEEKTTALDRKNAELEAVCEELEGKALSAKAHDDELRSALVGNDRSRVVEILDRRPEILEDIIQIVTEYNRSAGSTRMKPDNPDITHWLSK